MNKYECSDGTKVSESTIKKRLYESYTRWYSGEPPICYGCGGKAIETSHIIAKARCKQLHATELIWFRPNTFPACRRCHTVWEGINNPEWCSLLNVDECLDVLEKYDVESYNKRMIIYEEHHKPSSHVGSGKKRSS
jgi:hypothetical protein